jgi:hypothetical protein
MKKILIILSILQIIAFKNLNSQTDMEIPEDIINPINLGIEKRKNKNETLARSNSNSEYSIEIEGAKISFEEYLSKFEGYGPEKYKLSGALPDFNIEDNPNLIIKGLEKLIEFNLQSKYLSDYCYSNVLKRLIRIKEYEDYAVEKALYLVNYDKKELENSNLYWLDLYQILYDYMPSKDWVELIEKNNVLVFKEYYGYQGISRISSLYARKKGFECIGQYTNLLKNWKNDLEEYASEFHWYKFSKYEYALYGIRSIIEYNKLSNNQIEYIRNLLIENESHKMPGRIQDLVAICFFLTNRNDFSKDIEKYFGHNPQSSKYRKLTNLSSIDEETLLLNLNKARLSTFKIGELWKESHMVSSFPMNDKALWRAISKSIHFDAEQGRIPVNYDEIIEETLSKIDLLPTFSTKTISEKAPKGYTYTIEVNLEDNSYNINAEDHEDYYHTKAVVDLTNYILYDRLLEERLIPLTTDDQSAIYVITKPSLLVDLYKNYLLELNIDY